MKNSIFNYTLDELGQYFESIGNKKFRATQIFEWIYRHRVTSFSQMTNLGAKTIEDLEENFYFEELKVKEVFKGQDRTEKYLFELNDGHLIETVLMRHNYGNSVCVTSQVGCKVGCKFCASGRLGKVRNLTLSELVLQVLTIQRNLDKSGERLSNIVVMGIGEPFDNYENLLGFLRVVNYPKGLEIGARHITVSTSGIVPKIYEFSDFDLQINLAISLHAPSNEIRNKIMPINNLYSLDDLIPAVKYYVEKTNRRITFEYILLKDVNDSVANAHQLSDLIRGINAYVNLIPYNEVPGAGFKRPTNEAMQEFFATLRKRGINATLRMEHGAEIDAACGQLRAQMMKRNKKA